MSTNRTYLNDTVGILPPEARGCGDIETVRQMVQKGNSPDHDPSLDKSVCYAPEQIKYVDAQGQLVPPAKLSPTPPQAVTPTNIKTTQQPATWRDYVRTTRQERPFLFALLTILALFIIIKLIK